MINGITHRLLEKLGLSKNRPDSKDFNYRESGAVDSLEFVRFVLGLEKEYGINLTDEEIESIEFQMIGGLAEIIKEHLT